MTACLLLVSVFVQAAQEHHRRILLEDNAAEDAQIKRLEKLLGIKSERKNYLKGFVDDGLDFLLDFCDKDKRKEIINAEGSSSLRVNEISALIDRRRVGQCVGRRQRR